jgi:hypothetical protein
MKAAQLATLRFLALLFLLPGLAGLVVSAMISTNYLDNLPRTPEGARIIPRTISGEEVFQTQEEDQRLNLLEYASVGVFVIGLGLSLVYLERWGHVRSSELDDDDLATADHMAR